jgi:hypothetical protein
MILNEAEILTWLRLHLGQGRIDARLIQTREALAESHRPQNILTPAYQAPFNPQPLLNAHGFGWVFSQYPGVTPTEHGGSFPGFRAVIAMIAERSVGMALLAKVSLNQSIDMFKQLTFELLDRFGALGQ